MPASRAPRNVFREADGVARLVRQGGLVGQRLRDLVDRTHAALRDKRGTGPEFDQAQVIASSTTGSG